MTNLSYPPKGIVRFYNSRGTAEQWIKEGQYALNWTRPACGGSNFMGRLAFQLAPPKANW